MDGVVVLVPKNSAQGVNTPWNCRGQIPPTNTRILILAVGCTNECTEH